MNRTHSPWRRSQIRRPASLALQTIFNKYELYGLCPVCITIALLAKKMDWNFDSMLLSLMRNNKIGF